MNTADTPTDRSVCIALWRVTERGQRSLTAKRKNKEDCFSNKKPYLCNNYSQYKNNGF